MMRRRKSNGAADIGCLMILQTLVIVEFVLLFLV
jgi:hypothetical protein